MDECLFIRCMPYPYWLNMNQHQGSCTLRSSHMILLPCRLASSRPKLLTRPYVVEKREAGFERYGMATDASLSRTSAYSPVPHTSPSAPISVLFVCVCVYLFLQGYLRVCVFSVFPLVVDICGHRCVHCSHKIIHSVFGNKQPPPKKIKKINEETYCGVFELDLKVFEDYYDSFCCAVCTAGPRCWITSG